MMTTNSPTRIRRRVVAILGIAAATSPLAACTVQVDAASPTPPTPTPTPSQPQDTPEDAVTADLYRDGSYDARGWYGSLPSYQDVTLTIADGVVTEVEITTPAENEVSLGFQQRFAEALPDEVIGRSLDEIELDRVAGSSGCSVGFMNALDDIRAQAAG